MIFHGRLPQSRPSTVVSPLASDGTGRENSSPPLFSNTFEATSMILSSVTVGKKIQGQMDDWQMYKPSEALLQRPRFKISIHTAPHLSGIQIFTLYRAMRSIIGIDRLIQPN